MKIGISADEWYPVWEYDAESPELFVDLSEAEFADLKEVSARFVVWQDKLRELAAEIEERTR
jgi:hypothetical protein